MDNLKVGGVFEFRHIRDGVEIDRWESKNIVVTQGLNYLLNAGLHNAVASGSWYVGIFSGNYTPISTDTAATIASNATESTAYTEATRPLWNEDEASGGSITNSANKATFTINASATIYGAFLVSDSTKAGAAGTLFAASRFAVPRTVAAEDQLLVTYTVQSTSA